MAHEDYGCPIGHISVSILSSFATTLRQNSSASTAECISARKNLANIILNSLKVNLMVINSYLSLCYLFFGTLFCIVKLEFQTPNSHPISKTILGQPTWKNFFPFSGWNSWNCCTLTFSLIIPQPNIIGL